MAPGREARRGARREVRLPAPSAAARRALGPYARGRLLEKSLGQTLSLDVPWDVFSSQRIDEGTLLLLDHLPAGEPRSVLDLGCGYGALGLPVAARWPSARCLLIDRDLLAAAASAHNARALGLANVDLGLLHIRMIVAARHDRGNIGPDRRLEQACEMVLRHGTVLVDDGRESARVKALRTLLRE